MTAPKGFFTETELPVVGGRPLLAECGACGLFKGCKTPKMKVAGKGRRKILVVGEAPGENEDKKGVPFVGKAGELLRSTLESIGADLSEDCWTTNALICRPPDNIIKSAKAVAYCRANLLDTLDALRPRAVVLLGAKAIESLIGFLYKDGKGDGLSVARWAGWQIPSRRWGGCWIFPTFHPSHVMRTKEKNEGEGRLVAKVFKDNLKAAFTPRKRPVVPDYRERVDIIHDHRRAADIIGELARAELVAFDYETTTLKPDGPHAEIYTCSVSNGAETIAFPWVGKAVAAMKDLLTSHGVGKIAQNMKFEDRWSRKKLGVRVRGWDTDTMMQAHLLDSRSGVTGLKFQAFARLGQEDYSSHVASHLHAAGGNTPNKIRKLDLDTLLTYNGLDSLLEWELAVAQGEDLGVASD